MTIDMPMGPRNHQFAGDNHDECERCGYEFKYHAFFPPTVQQVMSVPLPDPPKVHSPLCAIYNEHTADIHASTCSCGVG